MAASGNTTTGASGADKLWRGLVVTFARGPRLKVSKPTFVSNHPLSMPMSQDSSGAEHSRLSPGLVLIYLSYCIYPHIGRL